MSEISVRPLAKRTGSSTATSGDRSARVAEAFAATSTRRSPRQDFGAEDDASDRLVAARESSPVGIVSVGASSDDNPEHLRAFAVVSPEVRGSGVASALVRAGATLARGQGQRQLAYWCAATTARRRVRQRVRVPAHRDRRRMRVKSEDVEDEVAMVLAPAATAGRLPSLRRRRVRCLFRERVCRRSQPIRGSALGALTAPASPASGDHTLRSLRGPHRGNLVAGLTRGRRWLAFGLRWGQGRRLGVRDSVGRDVRVSWAETLVEGRHT